MTPCHRPHAASAFLAVFCTLAAGAARAQTNAAAAAATPRPRHHVTLGVNYCDWEDRFGTPASLAALRHLRALGVESVFIVPTWYQRTFDSTSIRRLPGKTPGDGGLRTDLQRAREMGFRTGIKLHIDPEDGVPRSNIAFKSMREFELWWRDYRQLTLNYAAMAKQCGATDFSVGCELSSIVIHPYTAHWLALIADVRRLFGPDGPRITYSARHQNLANIGFLRALDYIGINTWPYFHNDEPVSTRNAAMSWRRSVHGAEVFGTTTNMSRQVRPQQSYDLDFFDFVRTAGELYGKPVSLTELGCQSKSGVLSSPVDWWRQGNPDVLAQAMFFRGFFTALREDAEQFLRASPDRRYPLDSVIIWNYMIKDAGPLDTDYTFRNKPLSEQVIKSFATNSICP